MPSITPGKYQGRAVVEDVGFGYTAKGTEQIAIPFEITQGECTGQRYTWFGTFSDAGTEWVVKTLRACGWIGDDLSDLGMLQKEVQLVFAEEEYEGKVSLKLKWVNSLGGGKVALKEPMNDGARAAFARRMRGVIAALPVDTGGTPPAGWASAGGRQQAPQFSRPGAQQAPPASETFDEVPF